MVWGGGTAPSPENVCISYIKMVRFYAFPVIFIDTVFFRKGHPNQKGRCPDTLDTHAWPPLSGFRKQQLFSSRQSARAAVSSCTTRSKSSPVTRLTLAAGLDWTEADRWVTIWPRVMAPRVSTEQTACTDDVATAGSRASASAFSSQRMNFPRSVSYTAYNDGRSISTCGSMA